MLSPLLRNCPVMQEGSEFYKVQSNRCKKGLSPLSIIVPRVHECAKFALAKLPHRYTVLDLQM